MQIQFLGAARSVTGSMHLVKSSRGSVLLDCGLFQGRRREALDRNQHLPAITSEADAVVLSHAHIDHSGALPVLVKRGYRGPIFCTPATHDLCAAMLADSAMIQLADARHINKAIEREHADMEPVEPLYDVDDVAATLERMVALPYHRRQQVAPGFTLEFRDAGHVLGSAIVALDVEDEGETKRLVFTGDLGRRRIPILRDPEVPERAGVLVMESTYGDRLHDPIELMDQALLAVVERVSRRGGKIVIPSFALERAQEIVYALKRLREAGHLPRIPVYVDSPLTVKITDVFRMHPECYDHDARQMLAGGQSPFEFPELRYVSDVEDSKAIDAATESAIIISASGMCEAGRVLHHLKATIEKPDNAVVIVGFQAEHTLGRRIVERRPQVRIFGVERDLRAEVVVLNGFSAHADQRDLVDFALAVRERGPLRHVALVHGETAAQTALSAKLVGQGFPDVAIPDRGETIRY